MHFRITHIVTILLIAPLSGCMKTLSRDINAGADLSREYVSNAQEKPSNQPHQIKKWWLAYDDTDLNNLITHAFSNSPSLNQIRARLKQTQAISAQSSASLLPALDASVTRNAYNGDNAPKASFDLSGAASYELDLWGKNKSTIKSNNLQEQATLEDLYASSITLSAAIIENWLDIMSLVEQEELINQQIKVNRSVLELQQSRYENGAASALAVLQQEENLARIKSFLPDILSAQQIATNNVSLLIGETPDNILKIKTKILPEPLNIPNSGLPSQLLENRPDIIAAWFRVLSADWAEKAAFSNRLPRFDISAIYSTSAGKISALFDTWLLNMAAGIASPIFDGGSRKAEQIRQQAIADERFQAYRGIVLSAVNEVENALARNNFQDKKLKALEEQLLASEKTLEQARFSYANGNTSYINVLTSINNVQTLEQQIAREKLLQAKERVRLYRALGGRSWAEKIDSNITPSKSNKSNK